MWDAVLARFDKQAPASVIACLTLERAMPAAWVDEVFEANRQRFHSANNFRCSFKRWTGMPPSSLY